MENDRSEKTAHEPAVLRGGDGCFAKITCMILQESLLLVSDGFVFSIMHGKTQHCRVARILHVITYRGQQTHKLFSTNQEGSKKEMEKNDSFLTP